ncbi:hypothetical protein T439DRAFT_380324 [Meredithblackwellia eburnea MCA 4105]
MHGKILSRDKIIVLPELEELDWTSSDPPEDQTQLVDIARDILPSFPNLKQFKVPAPSNPLWDLLLNLPPFSSESLRDSVLVVPSSLTAGECGWPDLVEAVENGSLRTSFRKVVVHVKLLGPAEFGDLFDCIRDAACWIRVFLGRASNGVHSIQQFHMMYLLIRASGVLPIICACVLMEPHHIHGFDTAEEFEQAHSKKRRFVPTPSHYNWFSRIVAFFRRHAAKCTGIFFLAHIVSWLVVYATVVWNGTEGLWQNNCLDLVKKHSSPVLMVASVAFISIGFVLVGLLYFPIYHHISAGLVLARLWSLSTTQGRKEMHQLLRDGQQDYKGPKNPKLKASEPPRMDYHWKANPELLKISRRAQIGFSAGLFVLWVLVVSMYIWINALRTFLLGWNAWNYPAIQNFILGFIPAFGFFFDVVRKKQKDAYKAQKESLKSQAVRNTKSSRANHQKQSSATPVTGRSKQVDEETLSMLTGTDRKGSELSRRHLTETLRKEYPDQSQERPEHNEEYWKKMRRSMKPNSASVL